jgi:hypothetical protein
MVATLLSLWAFFPPVVSNAQDDNRLFVAETGHWVTNDFLTTYRSVRDPQAIFGYPITEAFINQRTDPNRLIQYFQRALFELHPENPPELRVEIKRLGEYLYQEGKGQVVPIPMNFPACQYFPDTSHQVCYAFLDFFRANGGIAQFGYPISDLEFQQGRLVQYFQRACFEWHPELAPGERVVLADLGQRYFDLLHEDPQRLRSNPIIHTILSLQARAFPELAVIAPQGKQTIYVIVQDQNFEPVSNATVVFTIKYTSGDEKSLVHLTDNNGITNIPFDVKDNASGIVEVGIKVSFDSMEQTTRTSFRIWW